MSAMKQCMVTENRNGSSQSQRRDGIEMRRTGNDTADYLVTNCAGCGMVNIVHRSKADGCTCADCGGGPLIPFGYGILHKEPVQSFTVEINVERGQLDRLIEDVAAVNETVDGITEKLRRISKGTKKAYTPGRKKLRFLAAGRRPVGGLDKSAKGRT